MKHIVNCVLVAVLAVPVLTGCSGTSSGNEIKTIYVEKNFERADFDDFSPKIEVLEIFRPEFTDSTMFAVPQILKIADGKAYLHEDKWMAVYDYPSGKLVNAFNRYGAGPEEYMSSYNVYFSNDKWTVFDKNYGRSNIIQYAADGTYIRTVENDSIQSLSPIATGGWLAFNDWVNSKNGYGNVCEKKVYQYDNDWKLNRVYDLNERRWTAQASDRVDIISLLNGVHYVTDLDTICRVSLDDEQIIPVIAMAIGAYSYDWSSIESWNEVLDVKKTHFYIPNPVFNSRYLFARYSVWFDIPWVTYFDVYDIESGDLVYRYKVPMDRNYGKCQYFEGIPVELDGEIVYGWPIEYVEDDAFYFLIAGDEMARISNTDAINPIFAKIRIKD